MLFADAELIFPLIFFGMFICAILLSIASLFLMIWSLIDCVKNEPSEGNDKLIWILLIVLLGIIGSLIYIYVRRPQRIKQIGR